MRRNHNNRTRYKHISNNGQRNANSQPEGRQDSRRNAIFRVSDLYKTFKFIITMRPATRLIDRRSNRNLITNRHHHTDHNGRNNAAYTSTVARRLSSLLRPDGRPHLNGGTNMNKKSASDNRRDRRKRSTTTIRRYNRLQVLHVMARGGRPRRFHPFRILRTRTCHSQNNGTNRRGRPGIRVRRHRRSSRWY